MIHFFLFSLILYYGSQLVISYSLSRISLTSSSLSDASACAFKFVRKLFANELRDISPKDLLLQILDKHLFLEYTCRFIKHPVGGYRLCTEKIRRCSKSYHYNCDNSNSKFYVYTHNISLIQ